MESEVVDAGYDVFGDEAVYKVEGSDPTECVVIIDHNLQQWGDAVSVSTANAAINVRRSEVQSRPRRGSTFMLGDTTYTVDQPLNQTRYEYTLLATEDDD